MASSTAVDSHLVNFIKQAKPSAVPSTSGPSGEPTVTELTKSLFPSIEYNDTEKSDLTQWLSTANHIAASDEDAAKSAERLASLNTHLSTRTTILGSKPSIADLAIYARLAPVVEKWSKEERTGEQGYHHIVRHLNFVQNTPIFGMDIKDKVNINEDEVISPIKPIDPKAEKERKKREKEAAAAGAGNSTEVTGKESATGGGGRKAKKEAKAQAKAEGAGTGGSEASVHNTPAPAEVPATGAPANPVTGDTTNTKSQKDKVATVEANDNKKTNIPEGANTKKKEKKPKAPAAPVVEKPLSPSLIDLRVAHILKAEQHPDAQKLYVSRVACGDAPGTDNTEEFEGQVVRIVCSGLNGLIPLEEMQGRKIIAVCNLKPVTMRGIKSAAMVLAASPRVKEGEEDTHAGPVELVSPPEGSKAGDRVFFEGFEGEPEGQLNPKKKIFETLGVGFTTTDDLGVAFDAGMVKELEGKKEVGVLKTKDGVCKVKTLKGAIVR